MELYFWAFVVALLIFALGGAVSVYEGWRKILRPEPVADAWANFLVLGAAILFESLSFRVAWRELRAMHAGEAAWEAIRRSKDPGVFAVLVEDAAALAGLLIALIGLALAEWLHVPVLDGVASIAIGGLLVLAAVFMANETRSLLTGESASPRVIGTARRILTEDARVVIVDELLSMHLGPNDVLLAVTLDFRDDLPGGAIEVAAYELSAQIRRALPEVTRVFLRPRRPPAPVAGASVSAPSRAAAQMMPRSG
jgi:divalent metal cation (Fe/Co/Zn/Cd) transporter